MPSRAVLNRIAAAAARRNPVLAQRLLRDLAKTADVCAVNALPPGARGMCLGKNGFAISFDNNPMPFTGVRALTGQLDAPHSGLGLVKSQRPALDPATLRRIAADVARLTHGAEPTAAEPEAHRHPFATAVDAAARSYHRGALGLSQPPPRRTSTHKSSAATPQFAAALADLRRRGTTR